MRKKLKETRWKDDWKTEGKEERVQEVGRKK